MLGAQLLDAQIQHCLWHFLMHAPVRWPRCTLYPGHVTGVIFSCVWAGQLGKAIVALENPSDSTGSKPPHLVEHDTCTILLLSLLGHLQHITVCFSLRKSHVWIN